MDVIGLFVFKSMKESDFIVIKFIKLGMFYLDEIFEIVK